MSDVERRYHETWLGMVQPIEGLVFSVPVLVDASVMQRTAPDAQERFWEQLTGDGADVRVRDLRVFFRTVLGFSDDNFLSGDDIPSALTHFVPEGGQTIKPTLTLKSTAPASDQVSAEMLVWQLPDGLPLDRAETVTGKWEYPPQHKLDRLLRGTRIPVGLLTNGELFRLVFAPHGESTGALTFRVADMASVGGRPILDAFLSLLHAQRFLGGNPEHTLRALLEQSRKRQANVTNELAEQVFEALDLLLHGFDAAAERDGTASLRDAMQDENGPPGEHVYGGLLTAMLRLVFLLYAEDRDLMPMGHKVYSEHLSVLALFDQLQQDAGLYPDTMSRRFGAWPRLLALFRAVYEGVEAEGLQMPARRGKLFDPNGYPFLEGWAQGGAAPHAPEARAQVRVPSVDDDIVYRVLDKLLLLDGQRLSYRALDVEQIGSVYEALMGYHVQRLVSPAVCLRDSGVWLETSRVLETASNRREALVVEESALPKGRVSKIADGLKTAATSDDVAKALEPLRKNPRGIPIRQVGALVLQPGAERRRTSSHYTPRSLSAPIVEKTLKPLLATMAAGGKEPTADELLELKICDPAMGSGAFLVEACRFLADEVVKAWTRQKVVAGIEREHGDPVTHARRLVAQCCLYGVDKNPYAVTLAKLSLWLVSFAKDEPFTFVDHSLRWGDSLVGLSLEQLRRFHWAPESAQADFIVDIVTKDLDEAMYHRQRILRLARLHGVQNGRQKEELLRDADDAVQNARLFGDVLIGAFFAHEKDKNRDSARLARLTEAQQWAAMGTAPTDQLIEWQRAMRAISPPFHWPIEFPEIFYADRPDPLDAERKTRTAWMDAFVGNPPFMGKSGIAEMGPQYSAWLQQVHAGAHGNADYSAHFFRRCWSLLGGHGTLGLLATNTIAEGDTRKTGLKFLVDHGGVIFDATRQVLWGGEADVAISVVHVAMGHATRHVGDAMLDGHATPTIDSRLRPKTERRDPVALAANSNRSFQGSAVLGMGFVLTPTARDDLLTKDPRNAERIFPYIGGEEVNSSPTQDFSRYVISFGEMELSDCDQWPDLIAIVRDKVKPERDNNKREVRRKYWWRFGETAPALYAAIRPLRRCLVNSQVSKHLLFAWQPTNRIFSHALNVFSFDDDARFAVLQSRIHEPWARHLSSTFGSSVTSGAVLRYAPSDCFATFPFPHGEGLLLTSAGRALDSARAKLMSDVQQGLTTTYNQLKDPGCLEPRIIELRKLHEQMDRAVLDAYGWVDVAVPPYCPANDAEEKQVEIFEDQIIDRLFALNAERASTEQAIALVGNPRAAQTTGARKPARKRADQHPQLVLVKSIPAPTTIGSLLQGFKEQRTLTDTACAKALGLLPHQLTLLLASDLAVTLDTLADRAHEVAGTTGIPVSRARTILAKLLAQSGSGGETTLGQAARTPHEPETDEH